ncbi:MAG: DUF3786 domain-containing protein [Candidatus Magnetominusculus sp. LBB02]|nr:DUF3786 domain-containing protein [Candidatus Magnetominusculus sp. LBB02]
MALSLSHKMNTIELYKELPKTNCAACGQKTCMAFAIAVVKGSALLAACPHLNEDTLGRLEGSVTKLDVTEAMFDKLKEETGRLDLRKAAAATGALEGGDGITIKCLGRDYIVRYDGSVDSGAAVSLWIKILLLIYIKTAEHSELSNDWVSFDRLRMGIVKIGAFKKECESPLTEMFIKDYAASVAALRALGAEEVEGQPSNAAWKLYLLPKIPILILYWQSDEEFQPEIKVLFDSTAEKYLDIESLVFLLRELSITLGDSLCPK